MLNCRQTTITHSCNHKPINSHGFTKICITVIKVLHLVILNYLFTGKYGCSIDKVQKDKLAQQISTLKSNIRLTVRVPFQEGQSEVISEARQFQFYPEFHVQTKEIHLSTMAPVYNVRVTCVPALESEIKVCACCMKDFPDILLLRCKRIWCRCRIFLCSRMRISLILSRK